jgi:nucleoside-diphosphate-sugar epimerase
VRRVLITGAGGFLGRHCLAPLREAAGEVHAAVRPGSPFQAEGMVRHEADLLDPAQVERLVARVRPTHLLHLAWTTEPGAFWRDAGNVRWVEAGLALLRAFTAHGGLRFVGAGSCAEYDWAAGVCREGDTPLRPATLYGACKNAFREVLEALARQQGLGWAWGRVFFLYGPHEHPRRLVASVARALLAGQPAPCTPGTQERDFLHVADAAGAFVALLRGEVCGPVNVGSGQAVAVADVVRRVADLAGAPALLRLGALPPPTGEPPLLVADVRRLTHEVGWTPHRSLDEGLAETVAWWRSHGGREEGGRGGSLPGVRARAAG